MKTILVHKPDHEFQCTVTKKCSFGPDSDKMCSMLEYAESSDETATNQILLLSRVTSKSELEFQAIV